MTIHVQTNSTQSDVKISLISAMYRVERYLPAFLNSLEQQDLNGIALECIFVDDGSPGREAELAQEWLNRTGIPGRVVRKENGGVSSARNAGLRHATGEWVSFPDPDDILAPSYLRAIAEHAQSPSGDETDVIAAKLVFYFEETGEQRDNHPLNFKFDSRPQNLNLLEVPHALQLSSASAFIRKATLEQHNLHFDERLSLGEDAMLLARVFATNPSPQLGVVSTAHYLYRKRATKDSALDTTARSAEALISRIAHGYLPLVEELQESDSLREWVGHLVLYDLSWLYKQEVPMNPVSEIMTDAQKQRIVDLTRRLLSYLDEAWIDSFVHPTVPPEIRRVWKVLRQEGLGIPLSTAISTPRVAAFDRGRKLLQLRYFTTRPDAVETVRMGGRPVAPLHSKTRTLEYFGQRSVFERILWLPASGWLRLEIDGIIQELAYSASMPRYSLFRADYLRHFGADAKPIEAPRRRRRRGRRAPWTGVRPPRRSKHQAAWLFMDRLNIAQDNAEHLYRHVRKTRPGINAWYVLERKSPDWKRLKREGFKLVDFRSRRHVRLLLGAEHVISSHADIEMTDPIPLSVYPKSKRPWQFTFLQHGVTKDDLSRWLNRKHIDTFITATEAEQESIAGDGNQYVYTTRESVLAGFPRHDALLGKAHSLDEQHERNYLLIAPTWRDGLLAPKTPFEPRRPIVDIENTPYVANWRSLLTAPELRTFADAHSLKVIFLPHPQIRTLISHFEIPSWIETRDYSDGDVQDILARTRTLITDYSSLAFDVAYVGMPTVYFQFDRDKIFSGLHTYTAGYFDYEKDGFGPVRTSPNEVIEAAGALLTERATNGDWPAPFHARIRDTFPYHDGQCSERVTRAILAAHPRTADSMKAKRKFPKLRRLLRPVRRRVSAIIAPRAQPLNKRA